MLRASLVGCLLLVVSSAAFAQFKEDGLLAPPPSRSEALYAGDAKGNIRMALALAKKQHKRVIVDFGGDWCYDCHVLDYNLATDPGIHALLAANFVVAHVDVGEFDKNLDLCDKYKMTIKKGVPALAVLDSGGKLLYSDPGGFFEHARGMTKRSILDFLQQWAPPRKK
jgi:thiol:disulfide interchange protein